VTLLLDYLIISQIEFYIIILSMTEMRLVSFLINVNTSKTRKNIKPIYFRNNLNMIRLCIYDKINILNSYL
jgi:hypothetical protein